MTLFLRWLFHLALAVWLGETVFLSLVVAPVLFTQMPTAQAGQVMSLLFPFYYGVACGCAVILVACAGLLWRRLAAGAVFWGLGGAVAALLLVACAYAAAVVQPRLHELRAQRDAGEQSAQGEFDQLHQLSVRMNGAVLIGNLLILALVAQPRAWRPVAVDEADASTAGAA